jgi:hypothetical protein
MIVVDPDNESHTIKLIPRFYPTGFFKFDLYNEVTKETEEIVHTYSVTNGIMSIVFDYDFTEQSKFQVKLYDGDGVIYRGKIIATSQTPQDYKQTKDLYFYE